MLWSFKKKKKNKTHPQKPTNLQKPGKPQTTNGDIKRKGKEDYVNMQISVSKC